VLALADVDEVDRLQVSRRRAAEPARVVLPAVEAGVGGAGEVGDQASDCVADLVVLQERAEAGK
jgi:hypothetical protein